MWVLLLRPGFGLRPESGPTRLFLLPWGGGRRKKKEMGRAWIALSRARSFTYMSTCNLHSRPKGGRMLSSFYK